MFIISVSLLRVAYEEVWLEACIERSLFMWKSIAKDD